MLALLGAGAVVAPTNPATSEPVTSESPWLEQRLELAPATRSPIEPSPWSVVRPLAPEFRILLSKSIFSKTPIVPDFENSLVSGSTRMELDYVLRGVGSQGGPLTAFIENPRKQQVLRLRTGDPIARGLIGHVSLDGIDYLFNGYATHVNIGCALDGTPQEPLPPATTQPGDDGSEKPRKTHHSRKASNETQPAAERPKGAAGESNPKER